MVDTSVITTSYNFPSHTVAPDEKGQSWCLQFLRAMYQEATTRQYAKIFFAARDDYRRYREYAFGDQSTLPYKKWLLGNETNDKSWVNISWQIPAIGSKYRNIVVNKLFERQYNIVCTPIDPMAVDETQKWFSDLKAKLLLRDQAQQKNPELLKTPALRLNHNDPKNIEEFEMKSQLGFKTQLAMDAELGVAVVFEQNQVNQERRMVIEDMVDWGVGGYKDEVDLNDEVRARRVNMINFICSYCRRQDFEDMTWGGELVWYTLADLSPYFTTDELKDMATNVAGKNGNPRHIPYNFSSNDFDKFKVLVLDGYWKSYDRDIYKRGFDSSGNYSVRRKKKSAEVLTYDIRVDVQGESKPKYIDNTTEVVYHGKWVVDTNYLYDYGLDTDQKRRKSKWKKVTLPYHIFAPDFNEMTASGIMKRIIPMIDNYCNTYFKIQNFMNRWIPYIITINYDALENVNIGAGGTKYTPMQLLDMMFQTNVIVVRKKNAISGMPDAAASEPVSVQSTQMASELATLVQNLLFNIQQIRDVTGVNETQDGTGPEPRTNQQGQKLAVAGSNNAINQFMYGDSNLLQRLADGCLLRLQRVLKRKPVSGYVHSLGSNYVKFVQVSADLPNHEYAIKTEDRPDDETRQMLLQLLNIKNSEGLIEPEDYFTITNMTNLKEAQLQLIYSVKKRKEQQQQNALQQQQMTGQIQQQSAAATSQAKMQELQLEYDLKMKLADHVGAWGYLTQAEKLGIQLQQTHLDMATKIISQAVQHESDMAQIAAQRQQQVAQDQGQAA